MSGATMFSSLVTTVVTPSKCAVRRCAPPSVSVRPATLTRVARPAAYTSSPLAAHTEQPEELRRGGGDRGPWTRHGRLVAARDRSGQRLPGADRGPVLDRRPDERHELAAPDAGGRAERLRRALERDEEVGRERR